MRYVKGKLTKTSNNEWVFITRLTTKDSKSELSRVQSYPITPLDEEVVRFHEQDLRASHNMEYRGEGIRAELKDFWSSPEGTYTELHPSDSFRKFANKKTFAKLIYKQDEETTDTADSDSPYSNCGRAERSC